MYLLRSAVEISMHHMQWDDSFISHTYSWKNHSDFVEMQTWKTAMDKEYFKPSFISDVFGAHPVFYLSLAEVQM